MQPPRAERRPHRISLHGHDLEDDFFWLRDRDDPAVIDYLRAENDFTAAVTANQEFLRQQIFEETRARIQETDLSAPARRGSWWYGRRTEEGKQYPVFVRWHESPEGPETALLDQNQLSEGHSFCDLGLFELNFDQSLLAYSVDFTGSENFELRFKMLDTGADLDDRLAGTYYGGAWSADGGDFFYATIDAAQRPHRIWRHRLGTAQAQDVVVFEEDDERFHVEVGPSRDRSLILIVSESSTTNETLYLPADRPDLAPRALMPRKEGIRYDAEPQHGRWLVVTDEGAPNGKLVELGPDGFTEIIAHDPLAKIGRVFPFINHLVVSGRRNANPSFTVIPESDQKYEIDLFEEAYRLGFGENLEYETGTLRITYQSLVSPSKVIDIDLDSGAQTVVKETEVPGGYDPETYTQYRTWADANDVRIPITVCHRKDLDLPSPTLVYGYGAYESVLDPSFDPALFSLLDRGVVYAIAHVRGGGEMGRLWHLEGRMEKKANTFGDFIAAVEFLISQGISARGRMAARGLSAGGLLMGAVTVSRPDLWRAVVAEVPFVDAINTMLDASIPLTVGEWEEWGNPALADQFAYIRAYSPYDNTDPAAYPAVLATAGLNDRRVAYWEPAKWVAKLRTVNTGSLPILLKTDLGTGHDGPSGRYDAWREEAFILAFVLEMITSA